MRHLYTTCRRSLGLLLLFFALFHPATAQLTVVSTTPADGATNVNSDGLTTLSITFSAPLDTLARPEGEEDFLLVEFFPEDDGPVEVRLSADLTTVEADFLLAPGTDYTTLIRWAKAQNGELLDRPYVVHFTTDSALPTGSVSGTVSFTDGDPTGTLVGLFGGLPFAPGDEDEEEDDTPLAVGVVTNSNGDYTVAHVAAGEYFVLGFLDVDGNGTFEDTATDAQGYYDSDGDVAPDPITVTEGAPVTGIDFDVEIIAGGPSDQFENIARALARTVANDAALTAIIGNPDAEGASPTWTYAYYSASEDSLFGVLYFSGLFLIVDEFGEMLEENGEGEGFPVDPRLALPEERLGSADAIAIAEAAGGASFRADHAFTETVAILGMFDPDDDTEAAFPAFGTPPTPGRAHPTTPMTTGAQMPLATWFFFYAGIDPASGEPSQFQVLMDAVTGEVLLVLGAQTTAAVNREAADGAALQWQSDAELVAVAGGFAENLSTEGEAAFWGYIYYSATEDSLLQLVMSNGVLFEAEVGAPDEFPSTEALPEMWVDSDSAARAAAPESAQFLSEHPNVFVTLLLSRGVVPADPSRAVWRFEYTSLDSGAQLAVVIDAETGGVVTNVEDETQPQAFALGQNYPNPFNPTTVIPFQLQQGSAVTLAIYDVLGRRVATLVEGVLPAGAHTAVWDASRLASGVYYYRLEAAGHAQTRALLLQK